MVEIGEKKRQNIISDIEELDSSLSDASITFEEHSHLSLIVTNFSVEDMEVIDSYEAFKQFVRDILESYDVSCTFDDHKGDESRIVYSLVSDSNTED